MSNKTVIVILVIAAALAGFIFFFERDTMSTSERQERKNRVFAEYNRDKVDRLELKHISGSEVTLEKKASVEDPEGRWSIVKPKSQEAEQTEVESLLSGLDYLLIDRVVKGQANLKNSKFGLDAPRIRGSFTILGKTTAFEIGGDAEGKKVYFHTDAAKDSIYAVNEDILTALDKSVNDLRSKQLVRNKPGDATQISVKRTIGELDLSRGEDETWRISVGDTKVLAAKDQLNELIEAIGDLRAETFVADDVQKDALSKYGLDAPRVEIRATLKDGKSLTVKIGGPCKDTETANLLYAEVDGTGTVTCVKDTLSSVADRPLLRFEETKLAAVQIEDVKNIALTRGETSVTFERDDAGWKVPDKSVDVDKDTVDGLLTALTEPRIKQIDTDAAVLSALGKPSGTVTLTLSDDKKMRLDFYDIEQSLLKLKRDGEQAVVRVPMEMDAQLTADPLFYRSKSIHVGDTDPIDKIEIKSSLSQSVEKKNGIWQLTTPIAAAADMTAVRQIEDLTATIKVEQFVSRKAEKAYGFDRPFAVIKTHFAAADHEDANKDTDDEADAPEKTSILEIGNANTEGLRYARLKGADETVFLINDNYEYALRKPLVARDLLQIDDTSVRHLTFTLDGKAHAFSKDSDLGWKSDAAETFDAEALKKIVADLGGVKAVGAEAFGPAPADFSSPTLVIAAEFKDDPEKAATVTIGKKSDDASENAYLARAADLDVTFLLPARIVDDILTFLKPKTAAIP